MGRRKASRFSQLSWEETFINCCYASDFIGKEIIEQGIDHLQQSLTVFPDIHPTVPDLFREGEQVVARLLANGANKGSLTGQPPTELKVHFESI
jgi:predicted ester cyclase